MITPILFWPPLCGIAFVLLGLFSVRGELRGASTHESFVSLGRILVAAPLATFGAEHFAAAHDVAEMVPHWVPARLFVAVAVGVALFAVAISYVVKIEMEWASLMLGLMIAGFVILLHIPNTVAHPEQRNNLLVAFRDSSFSACFLAFFAANNSRLSGKTNQTLVRSLAAWTGVVLVFFAIVQWMHPECSPGVPSTKLTAAWLPAAHLIARLWAVLLLAGGIALVLNWCSRAAALTTAAMMVALTLVLYLPEALMQHGPIRIVGINYVADTLMYGGVLLLLASALQRRGEQTIS